MCICLIAMTSSPTRDKVIDGHSLLNSLTIALSNVGSNNLRRSNKDGVSFLDSMGLSGAATSRELTNSSPSTKEFDRERFPSARSLSQRIDLPSKVGKLFHGSLLLYFFKIFCGVSLIVYFSCPVCGSGNIGGTTSLFGILDQRRNQ